MPKLDLNDVEEYLEMLDDENVSDDVDNMFGSDIEEIVPRKQKVDY